jgi:hypothetical protein
MSSLFKQFKLDDSKLADGAEVTYAPNDNGSVPTFVLARMANSNVKYTKELELQTRPYRRQIELETIDDMVSRELQLKIFCKTILLGWSNVLDEKNQTISFSFENAMSLMKKLPELYDDLSAQAKKASLFRDEAQEAAAKN